MNTYTNDTGRKPAVIHIYSREKDIDIYIYLGDNTYTGCNGRYGDNGRKIKVDIPIYLPINKHEQFLNIKDLKHILSRVCKIPKESIYLAQEGENLDNDLIFPDLWAIDNMAKIMIIRCPVRCTEH